MSLTTHLALAFTLLTVTTLPAAEKPPVANREQAGRRVAAIFGKYCTVCHNSDDAEGKLVLQTHAGLLKGGKTGPAIVPGKSAASLLMRLIEKKAKPFMPPKDNPAPTKAEIDLVRTWIDAGAKPLPDNLPLTLTVPRVPTVGQVRQPINAVAVSPEGRWFAAARTGRIDLFGTTDGKPRGVITGLPGQVSDVDFSLDGKLLLAAAGEPGLFGEARIYDVSRGAAKAKLVRTVRGHRDSLNATALSNDGRLLATASYDRTIVLWNATTGKRLRELKGHNGPVFDVAFDPRGRFLASASGDTTIKLWHLKTGQRLDTLGEPTKDQYAVAVSPDGRYVVGGGVDHRVRAWEVTADGREGTNPIRFSRVAHQSALIDIAFSPDGHTLVTSSEDLSVKLWDTTEFTQLKQFPRQPDWPATVAFTHDGRGVLVGRLDGSSEVLSLKGVNANQRTTAVPLSVLPVPKPRTAAAPAQLPENAEREPNDTPEQATPLMVPGSATGVLSSKQASDADLFRFSSKQGESWVVETRARRDKSSADTRIEILHDDGRPVLRLLLRAVRNSAITFRPITSRENQARLENWEEMELNQFLYMKGEVVRFFRMPRGPDSGMQFYTINGQRRCYFDTSATAHARDDRVYIVEPHRPGTRLPDSGLPIFRLFYANDDDGNRQLGSDSRLTFTAPADGNFLVRVTDVRGFSGDNFKYRLTVREPRPGYRASVAGKGATIPAGSGQRFTVKLERSDGFHGPVRIEIKNLPPGFQATTPLTIEAGHLQAQGVINVAAGTKTPPKEAWEKVKLTATATILGKPVTQQIGNLGELKVGKPPKVLVSLLHDGKPPAGKHPDLVISAGETITAMIRIQRNGFKGELRFDVDNLPHGVIVDNIGLSGIMVRAGETERQIFLTAAAWVPGTRRQIHAVAQGEGKQASRPIGITVRSPEQAAAR